LKQLQLRPKTTLYADGIYNSKYPLHVSEMILDTAYLYYKTDV